jgi:hypothetical protein
MCGSVVAPPLLAGCGGGGIGLLAAALVVYSTFLAGRGGEGGGELSTLITPNILQYFHVNPSFPLVSSITKLTTKQAFAPLY